MSNFTSKAPLAEVVAAHYNTCTPQDLVKIDIELFNNAIMDFKQYKLLTDSKFPALSQELKDDQNYHLIRRLDLCKKDGPRASFWKFGFDNRIFQKSIALIDKRELGSSTVMSPVKCEWENKPPSEIADTNSPLIKRLAFTSSRANSSNSDFLGKCAPDLIMSVIYNLELNQNFNIAFFRSAFLIIMAILNGLILEIDDTRLPGYICELSSMEVIRLTFLNYPDILDSNWFKNIAFCRTKKEMKDVIGKFVKTVLPQIQGPDLNIENFQLFLQKLSQINPSR